MHARGRLVLTNEHVRLARPVRRWWQITEINLGNAR
jgi:hypothetical protein